MNNDGAQMRHSRERSEWTTGGGEEEESLSAQVQVSMYRSASASHVWRTL